MNDRGQTTIDFVFAIVIFLAAVTGAFIAAEDILEDRFGNSIDHGPEANRISEELARDTLGGGEPYTIERTCTRAFFDKYQDGTLDQSIPSTVQCDFSMSRDSLNEVLGLPDTRFVNVTIYELDSGAIANFDGTDLTAGQTKSGEPGETSSQIVTVNGKMYMLKVKVW